MGQVVAKNGGGGSVRDPWTTYVLAGMTSVPREQNETANAGDSDTEFVLVRRCFVILCSLLVVSASEVFG
ncbi:hypothetical protein PAXINDRAFT_172657, partial [Paxillus involutus ATCC 200175]